jgi:biopolymer transport protein ExbD
MAEVNTGDGGGGHGKHEKKRAKKSSTRIDMTPMVDLAFLLLTFFVLTSTFNKAKTMEILLPKNDPTVEPKPINNALTFILTGDNKVFYYYGEFYAEGNKDGKPVTTLTKTSFDMDGLHKVILKYNQKTYDAVMKIRADREKGVIAADSTMNRQASEERAKKDALTVLIKSDDKAVYKNVVDLIDELNVCQVSKQAIVDMSPKELELLNAANK